MTKRVPLKQLTRKEKKFLLEFPKDCNASQAVIRAGYSKKNADVQGDQLVRRFKSQLGIERGTTAVATVEAKEGFDRFLKEIERVAFFDPRKMFDAHGNPIEIREMREEEAAVIAGFEFYEDFEGKAESRKSVGYTRKFKLADKLKALELLGKVRGFYHEDTLNLPARGLSGLESAAISTLLAMQQAIEARMRTTLPST